MKWRNSPCRFLSFRMASINCGDFTGIRVGRPTVSRSLYSLAALPSVIKLLDTDILTAKIIPILTAYPSGKDPVFSSACQRVLAKINIFLSPFVMLFSEALWIFLQSKMSLSKLFRYQDQVKDYSYRE